MEERVKIKDIKTGAIKLVKKSLASDFIGTKKFVLVEENKKPIKVHNFNVRDKK